MLLDLTSYNLLLTTIGATLENLINFTNLVLYGNENLMFENIITYVNLLNLWLTDDEMYTTRLNVLISIYSHNSYIDVLNEVYNVCPSIFAFDYLHLFYIKQIFFKTYLTIYENSLFLTLKASHCAISLFPSAKPPLILLIINILPIMYRFGSIKQRECELRDYLRFYNNSKFS